MPDLKFLISKLNAVCRAATENAAMLAVTRGNEEIDIEHLVLALIESPNSDAGRIFDYFGLDLTQVALASNTSLNKRVSGIVQAPTFASRLLQLFSSAWALTSLEFQTAEIRSALLVLALVQAERPEVLSQILSKEWLKLTPPKLRTCLPELLSASEGTSKLTPPTEKPGAPALGQFTVDLTAAARAGALDPVFGRETEIRLVIDILSRRRQNNPILIGEPGVGKTAIVEGFALKIASGNVPPGLQGMTVRTLDLGLLLAGASTRGEFENRLKAVMNEIQSSLTPLVLFIDEAHMLIGGAAQTDAANLLKPALARGDLRTIAATTHAEYRKYFEKDAALARRFQLVPVEEPSEDLAIQMLRPLVPILERHHGVRLLDEAVQASVRLSKRYIMGRQLPDKAVGLLDSACARVSAAQVATPPQVEDCQHQIALVEAEIHTLQRENAARGAHDERLSALYDDLASAETQLADLEDRSREEKRLVTRSIQLRKEVEESDYEEFRLQKETGDKRAELASIEDQLRTVQGESPLVPAVVDARVIAEIVAGQTSIPVGRMLGSEIHNVLNLRNHLAERILGQDHALDVIARRVVSARAQIEDPNRPTGVFLLAGPSGVGKTETALALADILYGGERNAVVLNMSEYQEAHSVSGLKGAPPGYVGYDEGGVLTESIRRHPYCVLLLDEMEKAHSDVIELFYQIFDKGILEDAQGRRVDFRNTLILMTSNAGAELIQEFCLESGRSPTPEQLTEALAHELKRIFKPAFLSRLIVVPYYPVQHATLRHIVELKIEKLCRRLEKSHNISLRYNETLIEEIAHQCGERKGFQKDSGARNIDHVLTGTLIPEISERLLIAMADHRRISQIHVDIGGAKGFRYYIE